MRWTPNYHVACQIQKKILDQMDDPKIKPRDLSSLTNAWEKLEERKRILRMKPAPKAVDVPVKPPRNTPQRTTFRE